jgi:fructose-1,6-bisphosphatase I
MSEQKPTTDQLTGSDVLTLTRHLIQQQQHHPEATGDFTILLTSIQLACKYISAKVRRAGLVNIHGIAGGAENSTGDVQKKLDVISNEVFINAVKNSGKVCALASEEEENAYLLNIPGAKYVVTFDPLDGSSNIDANVSIGSIFGIWRRTSPADGPGTKEDLLQKGTAMIAAGYCVYGSSTELVLALGKEVNCYTLDPTLGEFILTRMNIRVKDRHTIYSINEGNTANWDEATTKYVHDKKFPSKESGLKVYSLRYVGSMVSDVHRTLVYGGIFMYPTDKKTPGGKLRILYECFPMSYVMEMAGGRAFSGTGRILEIQPTDIHGKCGVIIGSKDDVLDVEKLYAECKKA